ncbi:hypothetical protein ACIGXI_34845 [Kitasatospora aureofaciens]|uniref:hypothetical protein n=1 Tax=Kitasatospora aureofaciens TaxID=1894 RepID=UPI0037C9BBF6
MYLIHVRLRPSAPGGRLPHGIGTLLRAAALPADGIEHISVHAEARPHPTLGLYLTADSLRTAEDRAARLARRWVAEVPALADWQPVSAEVPFVAPFYERLLSASGPVD